MCKRCQPKPHPRFWTALCTENPQQHDSTDYGDHLAARERCILCFSRASCFLYALGNPDASGTLGGALFKAGKVVLEVRS